MGIEELRREIDAIDDQILALLNERAKLVLKMGSLKKEKDIPIYDPGRENSILARVQGKNEGPLDNETLVKLFEKIIEESRRLEDKT
jgi:chorismate mutase